MNKKSLYAAWAALYVICAALAFIPEPTGVLAGVLVLFSLLFFVPPGILLYRSIPREQWDTVRLIRNLSLVSLGLTLVAMIVNFLSVGTSETVGNVLFGLLIVVSAPMICGQVWFIGLFGWACLLTVSRKYLKGKN